MSEQKTIIHIRIRDLRREKALTQEELAGALGISRQSINAMEAGRCLPSLPVALQIASFFSVPVQTIFGAGEALEEQRQAAVQALSQTTNESSMAQLVPWSPLRDMREALDELMDESATWGSGMPAVSGPAANIYQKSHEVVVEMRLPGYKQEDLSIEVGEDFVTVSGTHNQGEKEEQQNYFRREFMHQSFQRTLSLPAVVEGEKAEAEMKQGMLLIHIPKLAAEKPKTAKIAIKSAE